jgi:hypothetical protein
MKKRLASLVLLLILAGGAFAGVPLHFGEQSSCSMGMEGMECCVMALIQSRTAEVAAAKLCCAMNCAQNGTTSPPNIVRVTPPLPTDIPAHPALTGTLSNSLLLRRRFEREHGPPIDSQPAYIRHLALLI